MTLNTNSTTIGTIGWYLLSCVSELCCCSVIPTTCPALMLLETCNVEQNFCSPCIGLQYTRIILHETAEELWGTAAEMAVKLLHLELLDKPPTGPHLPRELQIVQCAEKPYGSGERQDGMATGRCPGGV